MTLFPTLPMLKMKTNVDITSPERLLKGEWRLNPQVVQRIWGEFGEAQVYLFSLPENSHCQLFYSLSGGTLITDTLVHSCSRGLRKYTFIAKSSKLHNFRKELANFHNCHRFSVDFCCLDASHDVIAMCIPFEKWNEQPCVLIMPDLVFLFLSGGALR